MKYFCVAASDANSKVIPHFVENVRKHVRIHVNFLRLGTDEIRRVRRGYWRRKARYFVPALVQALTDVYNFFKGLEIPTTWLPFMIRDNEKRIEGDTSYVRRGDFSDIPGIQMHPIGIGQKRVGEAHLREKLFRFARATIFILQG